jgi:hypothetical protein
MSTYNQRQWIESFEGQLSILRPHLSARVLDTMSLSAWHQHGTKGEDPIKAAVSAIRYRTSRKCMPLAPCIEP